MTRHAALILILSAAACTSTPAASDPAPTSPAHASSSADAPASGSSTPSAPALGGASATPPSSASAASPAPAAAGSATSDAGAPDASEAAQRAFVKDNMVRPALEGDELQEHARALFDAIVRDDPKAGDAFWFPKEPFIPLKDVKGPDKYWDNLHATYGNDIRALHKKRKSWDGAKFVRFEVGSPPKWVKPGDEANKIGYFRSFHGKLRYEVGGDAQTIDVHTIISWQGSWFITHLRKFKK